MKAVKPKKNLGQHFLTDLNIAKRIADTVDACPDIPVLEIGPGMGVLTQYLVEKPRPVKAVESTPSRWLTCMRTSLCSRITSSERTSCAWI